jgi:stage III sporulation protein SpoIIIAA
VEKFKMKIQAYKQRARQLGKQYDTRKLKDDKKIQELFKIELKNRFKLLTDMEKVENENIEETWRKIQTIFSETSEKVFGFKEKNKKDWLTQQTWEKIREWKKVQDEMNVFKIRVRKMELQKKYTKKN